MHSCSFLRSKGGALELMLVCISFQSWSQSTAEHIYYGSTELWVWGLGFKGCSKRNQGDQLLVVVQALNMGCALYFKGHKGNER